MICPTCHQENPASHQFCSGCGQRLARICDQCGGANGADHAFCSHCGHKLGAADGGDAPADLEPASGERRQLTLLFCDLVGSTDLSARLDPEDYGNALHQYLERADEVVARHRGHVAQHLGDGVLAYFGWPVAYDDAAERAIRAALELVEVAATVTVEGEAFAVRVGLHTGAVVVSGDARVGESLALGSAPNIAARVQSLAQPGSVCITAATQRLVAGLFVVEELGARTLKGIPQPVELYRVVRPSGVRGRFGAATLRGLTPFVNRADDRRLLRGRFERACDAQGQFVLLVGEAGIGKSRLAHVLRDDVADIPHTWLETAGTPQFANTPFHAVAQLMQDLIGADDPTPAERVQRLTDLLAGAGLDAAVALPFVAPLLGLPVPDGDRPVGSAAVIRKRLLATLAQWLFGSARQQPLILLIEDLHWVDPSTLELMQHLIEQCVDEPVLLLSTARPEFAPAWPLRSHHTTITLNRLRGRHAREMVTNIAARSDLLGDVVEQVVARTGGVPLFIEELTRSAIETGTQAAVTHIPETLADSLMARLDRLGPQAKEVAQIGAICGREFSYALLQAVHPLPEAELDAAVRKLIDAELIYARGIAPDATYTFKHALVHDAALGALLKSRRRAWHARVAAVLKTQFPAVLRDHPEILAAHYTEAGEADAARAEWQRAGERAIDRAALREADHYLHNGLEMLGHVAAGPERDAAEFPLQLALGRAYVFLHGYSAPETAAAFRRARQLGERTADPLQLLTIFIGLFALTLARDGSAAARPIADEITAVANRMRLGRALGWAHLTQGFVAFHSGEFGPAREQCARACDVLDPDAVQIEPVSPFTMACCYRACAAWHLGFFDEARTYGEMARQRTEASGRASDRAWTYSVLAILDASLFGDRSKGAVDAELAIAACAEEPHPVQEALATAVQGWIVAGQGEIQRGIDELDRAMRILASAEVHVGAGIVLGLQSEVYFAAGRFADAMNALDECAAAAEEQLRSATLRRRAEILARTEADGARVEETYREAIACARVQESKGFELRAALSYAHWLIARGRRAEASTLLKPYTDMIREPASTDVAELRQLLAEMGNSD